MRWSMDDEDGGREGSCWVKVLKNKKLPSLLLLYPGACGQKKRAGALFKFRRGHGVRRNRRALDMHVLIYRTQHMNHIQHIREHCYYLRTSLILQGCTATSKLPSHRERPTEDSCRQRLRKISEIFFFLLWLLTFQLNSEGVGVTLSDRPDKPWSRASSLFGRVRFVLIDATYHYHVRTSPPFPRKF